jgi:predicted alpha/beta superfamily hydrolase
LDESELSNYKGIHLFIFVHGFQGNSFDMKQLKNNLSLIHPESLFMCSTSNEYNQTEGNIDDMGKRLAKEVLEFINENLPLCSLGRMSFIGHSLGGLIIRSCLPLLSKFHDKMFTYISLSSPHLGYMYTSSKLVEAGIWLLKNWKKSDCLT